MPERRGFVLGYLPLGGVGVELGVWQGDFSERLLRRARPRVLHLVDPWRFIPTGGYAEAWYGGALAHDQADMDAIHASVVRRFAGRPQVHVHRETSLEAARALEPETLDWV